MLNEFYDYIANNTLCFFQGKASEIQSGERYCLKLDNEKMVEGVDSALRRITAQNNIEGVYSFGAVYTTFTIKLSAQMEVVVASKIKGMTDDFLATLRNAELTDKHFPILMITHSVIDTITSGTGDLSSKGMPFHSASIISKIQEDIQEAQLSVADKTLLEMELARKQQDRYSDKSSLFEYSDLLTVLGRGFVKKEDYYCFGLLPDPSSAHLIEVKRIRERFDENHRLFDLIQRAFKHGNIEEDLEKEFDKPFIDYLQTCKKKNLLWYENYTFDMVKRSKDKLRTKLNNPLQICDSNINIYSGSPMEYSFVVDNTFFVRCDGDSKSKQRRKNILIFNPDLKDNVSISITTNISVRQGWIETNGCTSSMTSQEVVFQLVSNGCVFCSAKISDINNNIAYIFRICVIDLPPVFLESIQTSYLLNIPKSLKHPLIQVLGIKKALVINPGRDEILQEEAVQNGSYSCNYNQTLEITIGEEAINPDTGHLDLMLKSGAVVIPVQIQVIDEKQAPKRL